MTIKEFEKKRRFILIEDNYYIGVKDNHKYGNTFMISKTLKDLCKFNNIYRIESICNPIQYGVVETHLQIDIKLLEDEIAEMQECVDKKIIEEMLTEYSYRSDGSLIENINYYYGPVYDNWGNLIKEIWKK